MNATKYCIHILQGGGGGRESWGVYSVEIGTDIADEFPSYEAAEQWTERYGDAVVKGEDVEGAWDY